MPRFECTDFHRRPTRAAVVTMGHNDKAPKDTPSLKAEDGTYVWIAGGLCRTHINAGRRGVWLSVDAKEAERLSPNALLALMRDNYDEYARGQARMWAEQNAYHANIQRERNALDFTVTEEMPRKDAEYADWAVWTVLAEDRPVTTVRLSRDGGQLRLGISTHGSGNYCTAKWVAIMRNILLGAEILMEQDIEKQAEVSLTHG